MTPPLVPVIALATPGWGWREIGKAALLILFGSIAVGLIIMGGALLLGTPTAAMTGMTSTPIFLLGMAIYLLVVLAVYLFTVRRGHGDWTQLGMCKFSQWWWPVLPLLTVVQLLGMGLINTLLILPLVGDNFTNPQIAALTGQGALTPRDLALLLVLVAVMAPIAEELFFRGMLYPVLRQRLGVTLAIMTSALIFALIHFIPILLPALFFVGVILAWVRERSGSLIPCIALHAMQNGLVMLGIYAMSINGMI
ncbi:MAG: type II CAAX endopeptidase family protein [Caldilineaceae bacterium]